MAIKIEFTQVQSDRITAALCQREYEETVRNEDGENVPNPLTKEEFAKNSILQWIERSTKTYESHVAQEVAIKNLPPSDFSLKALKIEKEAPKKK